MTSLDASALIDDVGGINFLARTLGPSEIRPDRDERFSRASTGERRTRSPKLGRRTLKLDDRIQVVELL